MRGYETLRLHRRIRQSAFRIPMRGYEYDDLGICAKYARVPNPHEGL